MPLMVRIGPNPKFKAETLEDKKALEFAKAKGPFETDYVNAMEAVKNSRGIYMLITEEAKTVASSGPRALEDMTNDELKQMMLVSGVTPQKQMKRPEVIKAIRLAMEKVEITDDETDTQP